ncbi:MAG: glycosyltransferase family 2 protein [Candidatus Hodarchaeota archaeon]
MKSLLILPAYNEEGKIGKVSQQARDFVTEVLVVDDCSNDQTRGEASQSGATVIVHRRNQGVGAAIKTGMKYALYKGFEIILIMAGDAQDDPLEIPKFIEKIKEGYDFIQGSRYIKEDSSSYPKFRLITTKMYTKFISFYSKKLITDASNGYRAMSSRFASTLDLDNNGMDRYEFETYLVLQALRYAKYAEVPVKKIYHSKIGYSKMKPIISWFQMFKPIFFDFFVNKMGRKAW